MSKTVTIPEGSDDITAAWLSKALKSSHVIEEATVTSTHKTRVGEDEGFAGGSLLHLELSYSHPNSHFPTTMIAKFAPSDPALRKIMKGNNIREVGFYKEARAKSWLPIPHCYYQDVDVDTGKSILLLQDLSQFRTVPFIHGCDPRETEQIVRALAEIHVQWWNDPQLKQFSGSEILLEFPFSDLWPRYPDELAQLLPEFQLPDSLRSIGSFILSKSTKIYQRLNETSPLTCIHRDCHVDNVMFGDKEADVPAMILDWQIAGRGRGAFDIAYFLISSVPTEQRRQNEQRLIQLYHSILSEHGINDYDIESCWFDYRLAFVAKFYTSVAATVLVDNSSSFKRAWRQVDLQRLLAFCEDHQISDLLATL